MLTPMLRIYHLQQYLNMHSVRILNIVSLKIHPNTIHVAEENNSELSLEMKDDSACDGC